MVDDPLLNNAEIPSDSDINDDIMESVTIVYNNGNRDSTASEISNQESGISSKLNWNQQYLNTQLITAIVSKNVEDVKSYLDYHANPNSTCRTYKFTALHLAVAFYVKEIVEMLLDSGADPRITDKNGLTPLHYGAWYNQDECMGILIKHLKRDERTAFINRPVQEDIFVITDIDKDSLNHKCDQLLDKLPKDIGMGTTAVHIACQKMYLKCVRILVEQKLDINLKDYRGLTPFDVIGELLALRYQEQELDIAKDFVEIIKLIKFVGGQKGACDTNILYFTPIHAAVMLTSKSAISLLAHGDLDPNRFDAYRQTPIHLAIIKRKQTSLTALLECVNNVAMKRNGNGLTPFQTAVKEQWIEGIGILMKENVDIREKAADGRTVLHIAAATGNEDLLEELLKLNKIKKILNTKNDLGETPLHTAITVGALKCVKLLLQNGVDLSIKLDKNISAIHKAAELGNADILDALLEYEKERNLYLMNESDTIEFSRLTPLHMAAKANNVDCVKVLLRRNCDCTLKTETNDYHGWLAIHLAANIDNAEVVKVFLDHDKKLLHAVDSKLRTPLYYAAFHGHRRTIEVLLKAGANLLKTHDDSTILDLIYKTISNPTEFLDSIFDHFVSFDSNLPITDRRCMIKMDFDVLLATEQGYNQMSILHNILQNCKGSVQKELIIHPLIECFLFLKWQKIKNFFGILLFVYAIFVLFLTGFIICVFHNNESDEQLNINHIFYLLIGLAVSLGIVSVMDIVLIATNFKTIDKERIIKWISLFCALLLIMFTVTNYQYPFLRHIASLALISSWIELMFMSSKFPDYGYYVQMFCKVVLTITKVMLLFSCFIIGFALAFMIELENVDAFWNPISALMKTLAIMLAELDYNELFTEDNKDNVHFMKLPIYFLFILLATISLMNLMIGLAVNDIQKLETKGVVDRLAAQIDFLHIFESNTLPNILPKKLKDKLNNYKTIEHELSLYLANPEILLTQELNAELKESIIQVAEDNKKCKMKVSNRDILEKLDTLMKMIAELKNTNNTSTIDLN